MRRTEESAAAAQADVETRLWAGTLERDWLVSVSDKDGRVFLGVAPLTQTVRPCR